MKRKIVFLALAAAILVFSGCKKPVKVRRPDYGRQLPPGEYALRKITDPAMIPDITFACMDTTNLRKAIDRSLSYMSKPSSQTHFPCGDITHEKSVASLKALKALLDEGRAGRSLAAVIKERFDFYQSVGCDDRGTVLFTGYYTPIFDGSLKPEGAFQYPLYKQPADLIKGEDGEILGRKMADGSTAQYPARKEIEQSGMLKGQELIYLSDPFEVYIAHVQGSAKIRTPDGQLLTIGYAANNGHEYVSVGQEMIQEGLVGRETFNLKTMIEYFKANPNKVNEYVYRNPRFVFFRIDQGDPRGSLNEPVTAMRSIATDKSIYPRANIAFLQTRLPRQSVSGEIAIRSYTGWALDQDTGGAIRAPGRCDVYMGIGDDAGRMAGQVYEEGMLFYIFLKDGSVSEPAPAAN